MTAAFTKVLDCLENTQICVTRFLPGRLVGGKVKASKKQPFKIRAGVQQINGREREDLPAGWRERYIVKLYTDRPLVVSDDKKKQRADLLEIEGEFFEVIMVAPFRGLNLNHFKCFAARRNA